MTELNQIFEHATKLFFNAARNSSEASGIGISFANSEYPKEAYQLIKANFPDKLSINLIASPFIIKIIVEEINSKKEVFRAVLNYDETELIYYKQKCPPGSSGFLVLGAFHNCQFYIINPEPLQSDFQPFQVKSYHLSNDC
ncbi:MAG: hypothetical protein JWQ34_326 [Mucilaginibacter sp.]|uniref:hypothetical protein n=1 Tax=Mucilaginibacter sp. TaxID=1882438 RepID=UPI002639D53E|nr:hypothetical protein [Mucilaginibacter sp.]MDB5002101.1 hypothetical protein [Mucilaginibacter sp.]